jgi:hypothetical protein
MVYACLRNNRGKEPETAKLTNNDEVYEAQPLHKQIDDFMSENKNNSAAGQSQIK